MEASLPHPRRPRERAPSDPPAGVSVIVLVLGVIGALLVVFAELSTIVKVDVLTTGTCEEIADPEVRDACDASGFEQHGGRLHPARAWPRWP